MEMENGLISLTDRNHVTTFKKMEELIQLMQGATDGITMETNNIGNAFTGSSILSWISSRLTDKDVTEASNICKQMKKYNYIYAVEEAECGGNKVANMENSGPVLTLHDERLYRFQAPYYWPSINTNPDDVDYAIYLVKRKKSSKSRKESLSDHELSILQKLKELHCDCWDFIESQSEEQLRLMCEYSEADRLVIMGQEKIFWKMRKPQPGEIDAMETKYCNMTKRKHQTTTDDIVRKRDLLKRMLNFQRLKISKVFQSMVQRSEVYMEHDPLITEAEPYNPWTTDDTALWTSTDASGQEEAICERRLRKWGVSMRDLLTDMRGVAELKNFLESEFSSENIEFLLAVWNMKKLPLSGVTHAAGDIYKKFLHQGSEKEINIDSKTMSLTMGREERPNRYMFEEAEEHIFMLLERDSYPRFLRSDQYKNLFSLAQNKTSQKKKKFSFGFKKRMKSQKMAPTELEQKRGNLATSNSRDEPGSRTSSISSCSSAAAPVATGNSSYSGDSSDNCSSQNSDCLEWHNGRNQISYSTGDLKMAMDVDCANKSSTSLIGRFSPLRLKKKLKKMVRSVSPLAPKSNLDVPRHHHHNFNKHGRHNDGRQIVSSAESSTTDLRMATENIRTVVSVPGNLCNAVDQK